VKCPLGTHYFTVHEYHYMDLETEWINVQGPADWHK
jgi:hypothetical protein